MKKLNAKEQAVLDYIVRATAEKGYAPSVRDIGQALGYQSTSTVQMYLDRLLSYGVLCRENGKSRSLRVRDMGETVSAIRIPILVALRMGDGDEMEKVWDGSLPFAYCGEDFAAGDLFAYRTEDGFLICCRNDEDVKGATDSMWVYATEDGQVEWSKGAIHESLQVLGRVIARIELQ